jgi:minor histocompatibility antigen H13
MAETTPDTVTADDAATAATPPPPTNYVLVASYGTIAALWGLSQVVLIPYMLHLLLLVTCILYAACHGSIVLLHDDDPVVTTDKDGNETVVKAERETLRKEDAFQFPLVGSVSLFSLYLAFKFLDKDLVNLLIGAYFGVVGVFAVTMTLAPALSYLVPAKLHALTADIRWENQVHHPFSHIKKLGDSPWEWNIIFTVMEIVAAVVAAAIVCFYYFQSKPWYLNNVLGICFCLEGIERFSLGTYKIGAILLVGLFFYDIFWVFGTDVMVTVAKNLDGPIKILLPRTLAVDEVTGKLKDLSLLGLGDIVIPGFFLALLLRFDAHKAAAKASKKAMEIHDSFPKPYFHSALVAYVAGLGLTLFIMMRFNAAQPALLYLVPACLGSSFLTAIVRGEVKELLDYSEEVEEEEEKAAEEKEEAKKDQ